MTLHLRPTTLKAANDFVRRLHRHSKPTVGHKWSVSVVDEAGEVRGVAICGRPNARALDDGTTLEVLRTCTDGARNVNSMLYGAARACAKAMGYRRVVTYNEDGESGASLRAVGFVSTAKLRARPGWAASTKVAINGVRDLVGSGGVGRERWEITFGVKADTSEDSDEYKDAVESVRAYEREPRGAR